MIPLRLYVLVAVVALVSLPRTGLGAFTSVDYPPAVKGPVLSHAEVLSELYGGTFTATADGYTNGELTLTLRPLDASRAFTPIEGIGTLGAPIYNTDAPMMGHIMYDYSDEFGRRAANNGPNVPYWMYHLFNGHWLLQGRDEWFSSDPAENADGQNHLLVYYWLNGPLAAGHPPGTGGANDGYVFFWEDGDGDDFTDFVIGTALAEPTAIAAVPLPPAVFGGLGMLGAIAVRQLRRRQA